MSTGTAGNGEISIKDAVTWHGQVLTLSAYPSITINGVSAAVKIRRNTAAAKNRAHVLLGRCRVKGGL
ncbi:MAG: hypothetical protein KF778_01385 [Rhodocyclaceae bacterium]|nr:hypothetical protein [Rhodocyclaceae bacterium]MBX3667027.1 hypothetical protein [Rhodocyclaceae bacterium]